MTEFYKFMSVKAKGVGEFDLHSCVLPKVVAMQAVMLGKWGLCIFTWEVSCDGGCLLQQNQTPADALLQLD